MGNLPASFDCRESFPRRFVQNPLVLRRVSYYASEGNMAATILVFARNVIRDILVG